MVEIIKQIWNDEEIPEEWETAIYVPLHKKGDRTVCANYRGLSILNIGYKLLASVLFKVLYPYYKECIGEYQAGFISSISTVDNIFIVRQLSEKYREYGQSLWHMFIDYGQAYDSVVIHYGTC